jgi:predicted O-methyltransferase YrrM
MPHDLIPRSGSAAIDRYLSESYHSVPGMSSRFAAGICCGLLRIQRGLGMAGPIAEIGTFKGRFFIPLALSLEGDERALGIDTFDWPSPEVLAEFESNCARHGVPRDRLITWRADSRKLTAAEVIDKLGGDRVRLFHVDGDHSRSALTQDLDLATAVLAPGGLIVLDDMLHPGYPTLMIAVSEYLARRPNMTVLAVIDRESISAATKFVLCEQAWFKRYEERLLVDYKEHVWPMGADFEPHWCLVLSRDTELPRLD